MNAPSHLADELWREPVQLVPAPLPHTSVNTADLTPGFLACRRCAFATLFSACAKNVGGPEVAVALRSDRHTLAAQGKPARGRPFCQRGDILFWQQGNALAVGTLSGDGHGPRRASIGQGARPAAITRRVHLGEHQAVSVPLKGVASITGSLGAPRLRKVIGRQPLTPLRGGVAAQLQGPGGDGAATPEGTCEHALLRVGRIQAILKAFFCFRLSMRADTPEKVNHSRLPTVQRVSPWMHPGGFLPNVVMRTK